MRLSLRWLLAVPPVLAVACSSSSATPPNPDSGLHDAGGHDAGPDGARDTGPGAEGGNEGGQTDAGCPVRDGGIPPVAPTASKIAHLVVVVMENHSFDNYFSYYCTAKTDSKPTCNTGPACCETGPATDEASGDSPVTQDDAENGTDDPVHFQACELTEIDDGKMDGYVTSSMCGSPSNFAYANEKTLETYWNLAGSNALADHYFQSVAGGSSSNDMYLATASYVFLDDTYEPVALGAKCQFTAQKDFTNTTVADLLVKNSVSWGWFGQGYDAVVAASKLGECATDPACPAGAKATIYPCVYDPGDDPFLYFKQFSDNPKYIFDYTQLACDLSSSALPAVSYVKPIGFRSEHPGLGDTISAGEAFVTQVNDAVQSSPYAKDTLVLITWDESGGFFDHIPPPADSVIDKQPYGPRIPLFALGTFARKNYISHVPMEHSSIVKFIEWNWLKEKTGQLGQRDTVVNNIGDMLDPATTGVTVPAD